MGWGTHSITPQYSNWQKKKINQSDNQSQIQRRRYKSQSRETQFESSSSSSSSSWWAMDLSTMSRAQITLMGSGLCVMLTMNFTMRLLQQHLFYWKNPKEQKAIIIIILMAPIYAVDSFVGLLDIKGSKPFFTFLDSVKECYEALVSSVSFSSASSSWLPNFVFTHSLIF